MTKQINAAIVKSQGRRLQPRMYNHDAIFNNLQLLLEPGEVLIGIYDQISKQVAAELDSRDTFDNLEDGYAKGLADNRQFYAIPRYMFEEHAT